MRAAGLAFAFVVSCSAPSWCGEEGPALLARAFALNEQAVRRLDQGEVGPAEALAKRSLDAFEKAQGPTGADLATALCTLAEASIVRGDLEGGERFLRRASRLADLGKGTLALKASVASRQGALDLLRGRYEDAESHLERALEAGEAVLGRDHPALAQVWQLLGESHRFRSRWEEAQTAYERALDLMERAPGAHEGAVVSLSGLALVTERLGSPERARSLHVRAVEAAEKVFSGRDPWLAVYLAREASFESTRGDAGRADALFSRAVAIVDACGRRCVTARGTVLEGFAAHLVTQGRSRELARVHSVLAYLAAQPGSEPPALDPPLSGTHAFSAWVP